METTQEKEPSSPEFKNVKFLNSKEMEFSLVDGRVIKVPVNHFPEIKKLSPAKRKRLYFCDIYFVFAGLNEVFHIDSILDKYEEYKLNGKLDRNPFKHQMA